jgi:5-methylcytosine-specific restriction enzyme A
MLSDVRSQTLMTFNSRHLLGVSGFSVIWTMTKIRFIQPRLGTVRPPLTVPTAPEQERARDCRRGRDDPCRALYKTARWQQLRLQIFRRDLYTCQSTECGRIESDTSLLVCDHVEPHGGDVVKFWAGPFQTLCKRCHDREKQRLEHLGRRSARPF